VQLRGQFKVHDSTCGSGDVAPLILNVVSTRCKLVARGTSRRYPFNRRLGGPQSRSERFGLYRESNYGY
jgi:hypothetical protein